MALRFFGAELCCHERVLDQAGVLADGSKPPPPEPPPTEPEPDEVEDGISFT